MSNILRRFFSCRNRLFIVAVAFVLGACGGGGSSSTTTGSGSPTPTAPSTQYPIDVAFKQLATSGYSATNALAGIAGGVTVQGNGSTDWYAAVTTLLDGKPALDLLTVDSVTVNGISQNETTRKHQYLNGAYEPIAAIDADTGAYSVVTSFTGWPKAARVGDKGTLGTVALYSDATKTTVVGKQTLSYTIEAGTDNSAIFVLTTTQTDTADRQTLKEDDRYRVNADGSASFLSKHVFSVNTAYSSDLTLTASTLAPAKVRVNSPGPVLPAPSGLWMPASNAVSATGSYVYLQSDSGDYIGAGRTYTYTAADTKITVQASNGLFTVGINGNDWWTGNFKAMTGIDQMKPGYYGNLQRYPFNDTAIGGLDWSGNGRGCNTETGWFAVDSVTYSSGSLASIDLRFEQHCEGGSAALHGKIHWIANDPTVPAGPVFPIPGNLWKADASAVPATGNYIYLQSDAGDYIGGGRTYTYTPANATVTITGNGSLMSVGVNGAQWWNADFKGMDTLTELKPGYYGGLQRYPFNNPVLGGLDWGGDGRGCNTLQGWFVVDNIVYSSGTITAVDLRFEQHCEGGSPALHGQIHWVK